MIKCYFCLKLVKNYEIPELRNKLLLSSEKKHIKTDKAKNLDLMLLLKNKYYKYGEI